MRLTLHTFLTIEGVMQAPGGRDEDPDGGFAHGGWSFSLRRRGLRCRRVALPKYVASTTLASADWRNSSLLDRDVAAAVAKLRELPGDELQVHGSGDLAQTLIEHDLIDEYRLLYFPVHLGSGKKLFRDGGRAAALRLVRMSVTEVGVIIASYVPAGPPRHGSYALPSES